MVRKDELPTEPCDELVMVARRPSKQSVKPTNILRTSGWDVTLRLEYLVIEDGEGKIKPEIEARIRATMRYIVQLLVERDYMELQKVTNATRLTAEHIESGVKEYGCTLVMPPDERFDDIDVIEIENSEKGEYSVRFRLFTEEEGESDLELQATLIDSPSAKFMLVEIDGILVA